LPSIFFFFLRTRSQLNKTVVVIFDLPYYSGSTTKIFLFPESIRVQFQYIVLLHFYVYWLLFTLFSLTHVCMYVYYLIMNFWIAVIRLKYIYRIHGDFRTAIRSPFWQTNGILIKQCLPTAAYITVGVRVRPPSLV